MSAIENFLERIRLAEKSNSREFRLKIEEAREIANEINILQAKLTKSFNRLEDQDLVMKKIDEAISILKSGQQTSSIPTSIEVDGGGFS